MNNSLGHQSVDGVRSYKPTSDHLSEEVSDNLNRSGKWQKHQVHSQPSTSHISSITPPLSSHRPSIPSSFHQQSHLSANLNPPTSNPLPLCPPTGTFSNHVNPNVTSYNATTCNNSTNTPGSFCFNSCHSVVINITK